MTRTIGAVGSRSVAASAAADLAVVLAFAAVGRRSHGEEAAALEVLGVAWPFAVGAGLGWLATDGIRRPTSWRTGTGAWAGAVAGGMALRALTGRGVAPSFVLVSTLVLGAGTLGWRAVAHRRA